MRKSLSPLLLVLSIFLSGAPRAEVEPYFEPVVKIFSGLSQADVALMRDSATDDFVLLEHGELWDMDILAGYVTPSSSSRRNFFSLISKDIRGDMGLINYWNRAIFGGKGKETTMHWLESVVIVKQGDTWKLRQMHSTRVEADKMPSGIEFVELSSGK